jgi:hypothetical protein
MKRYLSLSLLLLCTACARHYGDSTLYQSSGGAKPIVAVLPVIENCESPELSWDISEEMTARITKRVVDSARLYLLKEKKDLALAKKLNHPNPQAIPKGITKSLGAAEYVIVSELIDQSIEPHSHPKATQKPHLNEVGATLHLAMRVRVLDVRGEEPKIVLQEVLLEDYEISRPYLFVDYSKAHWGKEAYERTPMGLAHSKIARELVAHVEGYIGANRR